MRTVLAVLAIWVWVSLLTAVVFAIGAGMGHRRAVEALREAAVQQHDRVPVDAM